MKSPLLSFLILLLSGGLLFSQEDVFLEEEGLVIMEAESVSNFKSWKLDTSIRGYTGSGSLVYTGRDNFQDPAISVLEYRIKIEKIGTYRLVWHSRIAVGDSNTEHNDSWLRILNAADFFAERDGSVLYPHGSGRQPNPNGSGSGGWFKVYQNTRGAWSWGAYTSDRDRHDIYARFDTAGVYTVQVSGRSNGHSINRIVLYHSDVSAPVAQNLNQPESPRLSTATNDPGGMGETNIRVFPSPATDRITIDGVAGEIERLLMLDPSGKTVPVKREGNTIDVSAARSGIHYLLVVTTRGRFSTSVLLH